MRTLQRTNRFARDIKSLPQDIQRKAFVTAQTLCNDIFSQELDVRPLAGLKGYYRVVVAKDYRLIFSFDQESIFCHRMAHRRDIYRTLEL